jgi:hypothetical protein
LGRIWHGLKKRNRYDTRYTHVTVCHEWMTNFIAFKTWALSNSFEPGLTIDRIDNSRGYEPDNCRWATVSQQARNRRTNRMITWLDETKCLADWLEDPRCPVDKNTYYWRVKHGWTPVEAISTRPLRRPLA